jgi:organic radical activating enzyme
LAESNKTGVKLVVVTGGEPLRQDIEDFLLLCVSTGLTVQIETNGTLHPGYLTNSLLDSVVIVVSPKGKVLPTILERANALKYVISAGAVDEHFFPIRVLGNLQRPSLPPPGFSTTKKVYIQPEDSLDPVVNKENLQVAVASCMRNGYTLCVQLHKIIGLK